MVVVLAQTRLKNKVVLVTGASGGLGEGIAYEAAKMGAILVLVARRFEHLRRVKERCMELSGGRAYAYTCDVGNFQEVEKVLHTILAELENIDILVNNAGFGLFAPVLEMPQAITEEMFRVNVFGLIQFTQTVARKMQEQRSGHIINIASQASKMATPKSAVYAATKFAVRGYSNALRLELKPFGIYVTTVNPGPLHTDFFAKADQSGSYLKNIKGWVLDPGIVVQKVVHSMLTPKREINLPWSMEWAATFYELFPRMGDYLASTIFNRK